jgi:hypothetical protein
VSGAASDPPAGASRFNQPGPRARRPASIRATGNRRTGWRAWRLWLVAAVLAVTAGCSALKLGYSQADTFVYLWLDRYVDFNEAQAKAARQAIARWFAWHRKNELADYSEFLLRAEKEVRADTTPERACTWWTGIRTRIDRAIEQAAPSFTEIAMTLTPEQIVRIEKRYAKTNKEYREDFLQPDPAVRAAEAVKRVTGRYETLYGELDPFQKERLERWVDESPFDPNRFYDELRARQQDALKAFRRITGERLERPAAEALIHDWMRRFFASPDPAYREYAERVSRHNCRVFADVHNSTSTRQRQHASRTLRGWAADLAALAASRSD